tara:strand:- start:789 stop:1262 length:474 start_codon:yes stop_codon:yes gene_type:complete
MEIKLVRLTTKHKTEVFKWRNDISTRRMSKNKVEINWDEHSKWFEESMMNSNKLIYIGVVKNKSIGIIRFEKTYEDNFIYKVSITIAPESRGKGYGKELLKQGINQLFKDDPNTKGIIGEVKKENIKSNSLFNKFNFTIIKTIGEFNEYSLFKKDIK